MEGETVGQIHRQVDRQADRRQDGETDWKTDSDLMLQLMLVLMWFTEAVPVWARTTPTVPRVRDGSLFHSSVSVMYMDNDREIVQYAWRIRSIKSFTTTHQYPCSGSSGHQYVHQALWPPNRTGRTHSCWSSWLLWMTTPFKKKCFK